MTIDLHSHSALSDGTDSPAALVRKARDTGLDVLALSDHDHALGWEDAVAAAAGTGLTVVPAIEVSTEHGGTGVHLLAYLPDPAHPGLADALQRTREGRDERLDAWVAAGERAGIPIDRERVLARSGSPFSVSKNHVADLLVEDGLWPDRQTVFDDLFGDQGALFIRRYALPLADAIPLVLAAGGVPVLAHPWGRGRRAVLPPEEIARLAGLGLAGLEVDHREHDARSRDELRALARELGLLVTGSSDHHGTRKTDHDLGCETTEPDVYARLLALAARQRAATGHGPEERLLPPE